MKITYAKFHRWYKPVLADPAELFGKKVQKRLISSLPKIETGNIEVIIEKLTDEYIQWFTPLYQKMLQTKDQAVIHDVYNSTLGNTESKSVYWGLTLLENGKKIGGTIFGVQDDKVLTVFKTYEYSWETHIIQVGPTILAEYYLCKHAYALGKLLISHGKDRNPYGINAAIGLATFKLSMGYRANILVGREDYQCNSISTETITEDTLILHYPKEGKEIVSATLLTKSETQDKYAQLLSYSELLDIDTILLP